MGTKVFIDGHEGTTGLRIHKRLQARPDIELIGIDPTERKNPAAVKKCMEAADIVFLCLPDAAAVEAVALADGTNVRIIDTSTAHRSDPAWTYGFAELSGQQFEAISKTKRLANPGCHASGVIAAVRPLTEAGLMGGDYPLTVFSLTGYSGGGKKMIAKYESGEKTAELSAPRQYGLTQNHKHLQEIVTVCKLQREPVFLPVVDDYYSGMEVAVPVFTHLFGEKVGLAEVRDVLAAHYDGSPFVHVHAAGEDKGGFLAANSLSGYDDMDIFVTGNDERIVVTVLFDNPGKGASGAAIENMNIMLGLDPATGLVLHG